MDSDRSGAEHHFELQEQNTHGAYDDFVVVLGEILPADTPGLKDITRI